MYLIVIYFKGILTKYGYLPKDSDPETMDMEQLSEALTKFQRVANMPMTGNEIKYTSQIYKLFKIALNIYYCL